MAPSSSSRRVRIRKRPVSFGNPSLGTYHGVVYTLENNTNDNNNTDTTMTTSSKRNNTMQPLIVEGATPVDRALVAMVDVPPEQVPEGVLNLARSHVPWIHHVRVVIADHPSAKDDDKADVADVEEQGNEDEQNEKSNDGYDQDDTDALVSMHTSLSSAAAISAVENAASILAAEQELCQKTMRMSQEKEEEDKEEDSEQNITKSDNLLRSFNNNNNFHYSTNNNSSNNNNTNNKNDNNRTYLVLFELCNDEAADQIVRFLDGQPYTCLDETQVCHIQHVLAMQGQDGVSLMSPFFAAPAKSTAKNSTPCTASTTAATGIVASSGTSITNRIHNTDELAVVAASTTIRTISTDQNNAMLEIVTSESLTEKREDTLATTTTALAAAAAEVYNCAVCLEHVDFDQRNHHNPNSSPSSQISHSSPTNNNSDATTTATTTVTILTTVCNHTFHMDCLLKWQDSPCPVCRYDHSGLNETLSRCHVCDRTENNFVCLICGVVSCGGGGSRPMAITAASASRIVVPPTATATTDFLSTDYDNVNDNDNSKSWNKNNSSNDSNNQSLEMSESISSAAVMSTTPKYQKQDSCSSQDTQQQQQQFQQRMLVSSHARQHYDETLHAYALDTESQHVWDFAGQGYVHRLLQNKEDGKLVEVADPNNRTSQERSLTPGLSDVQEGEVVHRKLEGFASQYYTLLKSQLEQQRIYYTGRLEEIRREYSYRQRVAAKRSSNHNSSTSMQQQQRQQELQQQHRPTSDWIAALKQERHQLSQRLERLQSKLETVNGDVSFLKSMNESLEANKEPLKKQLELAKLERMETKRMFDSCLPSLQDKVTMLMLQLETGGISLEAESSGDNLHSSSSLFQQHQQDQASIDQEGLVAKKPAAKPR